MLQTSLPSDLWDWRSLRFDSHRKEWGHPAPSWNDRGRILLRRAFGETSAPVPLNIRHDGGTDFGGVGFGLAFCSGEDISGAEAGIDDFLDG
jgi:hypothetical protein